MRIKIMDKIMDENVKKIVENHGGKIWAESDGRGMGSRFYVELNLIK